MPLWIVFTLSAAFFQTLRFMLQKLLSVGGMSATGATFARFAYAMPTAWGFALIYLWLADLSWPPLSWRFWVFALSGGLGQILATIFVVALFAERNFAVGVTLKKTEVIQTAFLGLAILGEAISSGGWAAIGIGLVGVLLLSKTPGSDAPLWQQLRGRAVVYGLASGFFFAISGVGYRGAVLAVGLDDTLAKAAVTVACVNSAQSAAMLAWLIWRNPKEVHAVARSWRTGIWLGLSSMLGSLSWFGAFALQTAAYVFALGQVELIFSLMASVLFFKERVSKRELMGIATLTVSILVLVVLG